MPPTPVDTSVWIDHFKQRNKVLAGLRETTDFIEREELHGLGRGLIDMVLLASTLLTPGAALWTLDKRLAALADRFGVLHNPGLH